MTIVEMKRVMIAGHQDLKPAVLGALQEAGSLHTVALEPSEASPRLAKLERLTSEVLNILVPHSSVPQEDEPVPQDWLEHVQGLAKQKRALEKKALELADQRALARPWGDTKLETLAALERWGHRVQVFEGDTKTCAAQKLCAPGWCAHIQRRNRKTDLLVTTADIDPSGLARVPAPPMPLSQVEAAQAKNESALRTVEAALQQCAQRFKSTEALAKKLKDELKKSEVESSLINAPQLFGLLGYCPKSRVDALLAKLPPGAAVVISEPQEGEEVPVALDNPNGVRQFEPLLSAFRMPAYGQIDPTPLFAPFLALFSGFCLGDLGYGVVLFGISAALCMHPKIKTNAFTWKIAQCAMLLGASAVAIGALLGIAFGIRLYPSLFSLGEKPKNLFYASLLFGAVQLTFGLSIALFRAVRRRRWQGAIGALAWVSVIPAACLWGAGWITSGPLIGIAVALLLFASPEPSLGRRLSGGLWALYNVISLLGNVASYARIFGLCLAAGVVALVVNKIAMSCAGGVFGWGVAILILIVGHTFNFVMAIIGAVVHPARLQFFEFFGTFFEGEGQPYAPFRSEGR